MKLSAAATSLDITPPPGHPLGGYLSRRDAASTGTHDPLTATLIWLAADTAGGPAAGPEDASHAGVLWIALDALGISASTAERIRRGVASATGIPAESVLICASHTHSGPDGWLPMPHALTTRPPDERLTGRLVGDLVNAAGTLAELRRPVTAGWAVVPAVGVGANRNDPAGPHDDTTGVLALYDDRGEAMAVLVDYACHPTILSHDNLRYSADFPGAARTVAATALHAVSPVEGRPARRPVVAVLQGAAGDISTRFTRRAQSFAETARLGGMLGAATVHGALAGDGLPLGDAPVVRRSVVELPLRAMPTRTESRTQVEQTEAAWRQVAEDPASPQARIARGRYEGALIQAGLQAADLPASMRLPIAVVAFGDVAWAHVPVELFASYGTAIAAASPFPYTRVVGYTDGYFGYVADPPAHSAGSYEARSSLFDADAGGRLVNETVRLLERSRAESSAAEQA